MFWTHQLGRRLLLLCLAALLVGSHTMSRADRKGKEPPAVRSASGQDDSGSALLNGHKGKLIHTPLKPRKGKRQAHGDAGAQHPRHAQDVAMAPRQQISATARKQATAELVHELYQDNPDLSHIIRLVSKGADVNGKGRFGWTALMVAASAGRVDCVSLFLAHDANVNEKRQDDKDKTALMDAVGNIDCVRLLLAHGANVNAHTKDGWTALTYAVGHIDCVRLLLAHGADVNAQREGGDTALMWAALEGHADCVRLLLAHGANVNAQGEFGRTALMQAASEGNADCVRLLLEHNANVNINGADGSALTMAECSLFSKYSPDCVRLLLEYNANTEQRSQIDHSALGDIYNNSGNTVLISAAKHGHMEAVSLLLMHGADVDAKNTFNKTALMEAAEKGHTDCVRLLLAHKANVNAKDIDGNSALKLAQTNEIKAMLLEAGAQ